MRNNITKKISDEAISTLIAITLVIIIEAILWKLDILPFGASINNTSLWTP